MHVLPINQVEESRFNKRLIMSHDVLVSVRKWALPQLVAPSHNAPFLEPGILRPGRACCEDILQAHARRRVSWQGSTRRGGQCMLVT